jgi:hypothetical protein
MPNRGTGKISVAKENNSATLRHVARLFCNERGRSGIKSEVWMLDFKKVKSHAGMKLVGDYSTLLGLHELIHKVAASSPLLREPSQAEFLLGLGYDVRKAFERQRDIINPPKHAVELGVRYGVNVLWPVYLVQVRLLREAMGFMATDERDQGVAFLLEHATLAGLAADIGGSEIVTQWRRLSCNPASLTALVDSRAGIFLSWSDAERKKGLGQILDSLDPMFEFWFERSPAPWQAGISPASFAMAARWSDYPDPRW